MGGFFKRSLSISLSVSFFLANFHSQPSFADEGMWVFNNLPLQQLKDKYDFVPTEEWKKHVMRSSVRFNSGGSGSFISSNGLVLTNHHVAADTLQKVSSAEHNYLKDGFLAKSQAEEIPAKDLELNQLVEIQDVTEKVNAAVKPEMTAEEANKARRAVMAEQEKACVDATGLRCEVVTLYQGGQYHLYQYKKYTDVRVVFAPESDIAFFGGDPDNFEFPRYDLDMTIMRVYENGQPAKIEHFLKWSTKGVDENDLIFVSGHPGKTSRLFTVDALKFQRDTRVPLVLTYLQRRENYLKIYSEKGKEEARKAKEDLFYIQNSRKVYIGRNQGLFDPKVLQNKQREEYQLRAQVKARPELKAFEGAWDKIAVAQKEHAKTLYRRMLLEGGWAFDSVLFGYARTLVRMANEDLKPNADRLAEYRDSNRESLEQSLFSEVPVYVDFEKYKLETSLGFLLEELGADHALVKSILQGRDVATRVDEILSKTTLGDSKTRRFLGTGDAKTRKKLIDSTYDPLLQLAQLVDKTSLKLRKQYEEKVLEAERQAYAQIANAIFATKGTSVYPDATFTLRLSYGTVKGYEAAGKKVPAWTTLGGAFDHESAHGGEAPWKLPASWHNAKSKFDLSTPFNFVSTADIIGGNSGSPVLNRNGELVGLIFDGNIQSLTGDFFYSDQQSRAVSVHAAGMLEAMAKIYDAKELVDQIGN